MHKQTVCKQINQGRTKVSSDRGLRVMEARQIPVNVSGSRRFNIRDDDWVVGIHNDIAVQYDDTYAIGRIIRMRKRYANGNWRNCKKPVNIQEDRIPLGDLYVSCYWYTEKAGRRRGRGQQGEN